MKRKLLIALGIVLALLVLAVGGAWWWVHSEAGGRFIRAKALEATKELFAGRLEFGTIELTGTAVTVRELKLYTPENELVAEVAAVSAEINLGALLKKTVQLRAVSIETPKLYLKSDERGLNLSRAIASKSEPKAEVDDGKPSALKIEIDQLALTNGFVSFDADDQHVAFEAFEAKGKAAIALSPLKVDSELRVDSRLLRPLSAPLSLNVKTSSPPAGAAIDANVVLSLGDDHLEASGSWPALSLQVKNTSLQSQTIKVFVPEYPIKPTVLISADVTDGKGAVKVEAGGSKIDAALEWADSFNRITSLSLEAKDVDLAELLGQGKPSRIVLSAKGSMSDVKKISGALTLDGSWSTPQGKKLASLEAEVKANHGEYWAPKLSVIVPGVSVAVNGKGSTKELNVSGVIDVSDLSKVGSTVKEFTGSELPPMAGNGHLNINATGTLTHPTVNVTGTLSALKVATVSVQTLEVDVHVPDVQRPFDSDGEIAAKQLLLGDTKLDEVKAVLSTHGRIFEATLSTKGLGDLTVRAAGKLDEDQNGLALNEMELRSAEGVWALEAPSQVLWSPKLVVQPLKLASAGQRIEVSGSKNGSTVDASINIIALDLAKLPRAVAPEKLKLAGVLTAIARVDGKLPRPNIEARIALEKGAAAGFDGINVNADAAWKDKRAAGQFLVKTPLGNVKGDVNLDIDAFINERPEPLSAHVDITDVDVANVAKLTKQDLPVTAQLTGKIDVSGTADAPRVKVVIDSPEVVVTAGQPVTLSKVSLELITRDNGELGATVSATAFEGFAHVELSTPFTVAGLRKGLPTAESIKKLPVTVAVDVSAISLEAVKEAGFIGGSSGVTGRIGLQGQVTGTFEDPRATMTLRARKVVYPPLEQGEAEVTVTANEASIQLSANVSEKSKPLVKVEGSVQAPLARLMKVDTLGAEAVKLVATFFPLELKTVVPADSGLTGLAGASFTIDGTLDAPRYNLSGSVGQLAYSKAAIGSARFEVKGGGSQHSVDVAIGGMGQDDLKVHGTAEAELGLAAVRRGLTPLKYPVDVTLKSKNFDLGFFSGVTPVVRVIGGKLTMNASVKGTLGAPKLDGDAQWVNGSLNLAGFGNYREIELLAKASNSFISLSKLRMVSGAGWVQIAADATKTGESGWRLEANGETEKFPIVVDDQPLAIASIKFDLNGELNDSFLNIQKLTLPRVYVELPDVRRKDLQNLDRPSDVIIVRGGGAGDLAKRARTLEKKKAQKKETQSAFTARAVIDAPGRIQVKGSDIDLDLRLSEGFRFAYANNAQLYGEAQVWRGKLAVIGREFVVQRGSEVRFAGSATEPYIAVTAVYSNNKSDDRTKVNVSVTGRGTDVALKVSSEPPLSESEIYTLLATGRPALSRGGGSSMTPTQAASVVGGALLAQAKTIIAKNVPIDVLDFESGENFSGVKLNVGKYLTDTLFLGYSLNPGADVTKGQNPHTVKLEYQLSRRWTLEAAAGTAPAAAADIIWTRDF